MPTVALRGCSSPSSWRLLAALAQRWRRRRRRRRWVPASEWASAAATATTLLMFLLVSTTHASRTGGGAPGAATTHAEAGAVSVIGVQDDDFPRTGHRSRHVSWFSSNISSNEDNSVPRRYFFVANVVRAGCYIRHETPEGYLESPNYPGDYPSALDCCYDIARPSPQHCGVKLYAEHLTIRREEADGAFCRTDWLAMESCVPEGGSRFCGNLTGTTLQYLFQPGARALRFQFHSSPRRGSTAGRQRTSPRNPLRFRLRYRTLTDCKGLFQEASVSALPLPPSDGGSAMGRSEDAMTTTPCYARILDKRGAIRTPRHPRDYPAALDCVYEFIRPNPFVCGVRMRSVRFDLEPAIATPFGGACSDFLQAPGCGFLCGKLSFTWLALYQPGAISQRFHFHSDEENHFPGFLIAFEQLYHCQQS